MATDIQRIAAGAARHLARGMASTRWTPLPHQIPPDSSFYGWLLMAGRGAGKTDACAEYMAQHVKGPPCLPGPSPHWMGIIAPTLGDAATSCFSGPSGIRAHDPSAQMVTTKGGTVVRWPNGSEAKLFGAHTEEETDRLRSGGNRCISEHTLIKTDRGDVPIQDVRAGDRVWTRNGLRAVLKVWDNGERTVREYRHAAGSTWMTDDHEVWTDRGWREARMVEPDDTVYTWENTGIPSDTPVSLGTGARQDTTPAASTDFCTGESTGTTMVRFLTDGRSTTGITTSPTTIRQTWKRVRRLDRVTTRRSIRNHGSGTARAAWRRQSDGSRALSHVSVVVPSSPQSAQLSVSSSSVPDLAGTPWLRHEHGKNGCAACAATSSNARPVMQSVPVRGGALQSSPTSRVARVYDLTVEHDHEFFAGGLLSSNCLFWLEELAAWRYLDDAWAQMRFGLRVGPHPHWIGSTTPKTRPLIRRLNDGRIPNTVLTRGSMYDNPHLSVEVRAALEEEYAGTPMGRQELLGLLIEEDENALWSRKVLDAGRISERDLPDLGRISVGVDPSGGAGEQGIIVVGKSKRLLPPVLMPPDILPEGSPAQPMNPRYRGFVLADRTVHLKPEGWGKAVVRAAVEWEADEIFVEVNYGGDMCISTVGSVLQSEGLSIPIRPVRATRGKAIRAQPVSALSYQGAWSHVGEFPELEDQMTTWTPESDWSPDRLDGSVWNAHGLRLVGPSVYGRGHFGGSMASKQITPQRRP